MYLVGYRSAPREVGEDMGALHRAMVSWFKERSRHRFGIKYLQNILFFVFPCGIIKSFQLQYTHEGDIKTALALKKEYPAGGKGVLPCSFHPCMNVHDSFIHVPARS